MSLSIAALVALAAAVASPGVPPVTAAAVAAPPPPARSDHPASRPGADIAPGHEARGEQASDPGPVPGPASPHVAHGVWQWPLQPRPVLGERFDPPQHRYGTGHRGLDLQARAGQEVLAVAAGTVTHAGVVAGRGTVTVQHADGLRSTYEPVTALVRRGSVVRQGQAVGRLVAGHCPPGACLHLGARAGQDYLDPLALLPATRIVLLPMSGGQAPTG